MERKGQELTEALGENESQNHEILKDLDLITEFQPPNHFSHCQKSPPEEQIKGVKCDCGFCDFFSLSQQS